MACAFKVHGKEACCLCFPSDRHRVALGCLSELLMTCRELSPNSKVKPKAVALHVLDFGKSRGKLWTPLPEEAPAPHTQDCGASQLWNGATQHFKALRILNASSCCPVRLRESCPAPEPHVGFSQHLFAKAPLICEALALRLNPSFAT